MKMHQTFSFVFTLFVTISTNNAFLYDLRARVYIFRAEKNINEVHEIMGIVDFQQNFFTVKINGTIGGLTPGLHGFHVHEKGDIGDGCLAAGPHYNPLRMEHGGPGHPLPTNRHVGDLGNIYASESGVATIDGTYFGVSLIGPFSIIGRAIVVHEKEDDLGRGNASSSKATGNSGGRVGCGVIGIL